MRYLRIFLCLLMAGFLNVHAKEGELTASGAFSRATQSANGAVFLKIHNHMPQDVRLLAAVTDVSEKCEIHESKEVDGISQMRELQDGLLIPQGTTVELKPGGLHIMLMSLKKEGLAENDSFDITLIFDNNKKIDLTVRVRGPGATNCGCSKEALCS